MSWKGLISMSLQFARTHKWQEAVLPLALTWHTQMQHGNILDHKAWEIERNFIDTYITDKHHLPHPIAEPRSIQARASAAQLAAPRTSLVPAGWDPTLCYNWNTKE